MSDTINIAPKNIIQEVLEQEALERNIRFVGKEMKKKGDRENQEFTDVYTE